MIYLYMLFVTLLCTYTSIVFLMCIFLTNVFWNESFVIILAWLVFCFMNYYFGKQIIYWPEKTNFFANVLFLLFFFILVISFSQGFGIYYLLSQIILWFATSCYKFWSYYTPTQQVGCILESTCPSIIPSVRLSKFCPSYLGPLWMDQFHIWCVASYRWGIHFKLSCVLSDWNCLFFFFKLCYFSLYRIEKIFVTKISVPNWCLDFYFIL